MSHIQHNILNLHLHQNIIEFTTTYLNVKKLCTRPIDVNYGSRVLEFRYFVFMFVTRLHRLILKKKEAGRFSGTPSYFMRPPRTHILTFYKLPIIMSHIQN